MFDWGTVVGSGIAAGADILTTNSTNAANREMAQNQTDFQERMSNTAYQRAVRDMRAAGINPMLAFSKGGASTPTGSLVQATKSDVGDIIQRGASNALQARQIDNQLKEIQSRIDVNDSQQKVNQQTEKNIQMDTMQKKVNTAAAAASLPLIEEKGRFEERNKTFLAPIDSIMDRINALFHGAQTGSTIYNQNKPIPKRPSTINPPR